MGRLTKVEATARFRTLLTQGQQIADKENRRFAIVRDATEGFSLKALDELKNYRQRSGIVKRIRPHHKDPSTTTPSGEENAVHQVRGDRAPE